MSVLNLLRSSYDPVGNIFIRKYLPSTGTWYAVAGGDNKYVALRGQTELTNIGAFSSDGYSWSNITITGNTLNKYDIGYGAGKFLSPGYNSTRLVESTDGVNWTTRSITSRAWTSITHGNNIWVMTSNSLLDTTDGFAFSTNNGVNWSYRRATSLRNWWKVRYCGNLFLAVSLSNRYATTADGNVWTERSFPTTGTEQWRTPFHGNGVTIVAGLNNNGQTDKILRSTDNINWEIITLPSAAFWTTGVYTGRLYVLIGYGPTIAISEDSINWRILDNAVIREDNNPFASTNIQNAVYVDNKIFSIGFSCENIYVLPLR